MLPASEQQDFWTTGLVNGAHSKISELSVGLVTMRAYIGVIMRNN